jgi:hypothetical protein
MWPVFLVAVVEKLLDAIHRSVIGESDGTHAVVHGLVYQTLDAGLPVEERILGVNV